MSLAIRFLSGSGISFDPLKFGTLGVPQSAGSREIGFGHSEIEIEVKADGDVVVIVGDIEFHDFVFLAVFRFHEGEHQATVGGAGVFHLEFFLAVVDYVLPFAALAIGHEELDAVTFLEPGGIEGACAQEHADHVVGAIGAGVFVQLRWLAVAPVAHVDMAIACGIGIPHFFLPVGFPFECPFAVILWREVHSGVGDKGVTHPEHFVGTCGSACDEIGFEGGTSVVGGAGDVHGCGSCLDPYEFPVEVEVIDKGFSAFEGSVLR